MRMQEFMDVSENETYTLVHERQRTIQKSCKKECISSTKPSIKVWENCFKSCCRGDEVESGDCESK